MKQREIDQLLIDRRRRESIERAQAIVERNRAEKKAKEKAKEKAPLFERQRPLVERQPLVERKSLLDEVPRLQVPRLKVPRLKLPK